MRDWRPVDLVEAEKLFDRIRAAHPQLHMILDKEPEHVDLEMTVPVQDGLSFPVRLNLQGDELHLEAGQTFWMGWLPGHEPQVADSRAVPYGLPNNVLNADAGPSMVSS